MIPAGFEDCKHSPNPEPLCYQPLGNLQQVSEWDGMHGRNTKFMSSTDGYEDHLLGRQTQVCRFCL